MQNRNILFDKLKTIAMLGIVMIHMIYHCNLLEILERNSITYTLVEILYTIGFSMTNVFVLITSHLLIDQYAFCKKKLDIKKVIGLSITTSMYSTIIYIGMSIIGIVSFSILDLLKCIFSVFVNQYWFIGTYIVLYLLAPFLTKMLKTLSIKELELLIIILLFFFSFLPTIMIFVPAQSLYDPYNGKSVPWFITMYTVVFYIKKHKDSLKVNLKRNLKTILLVVNILLLTVSRKILFYLSNHLGLSGDGEGRLYFDSSLFIFAISCLIYLIIIERKEASTKKNNIWILVSQCSLAVYLIHNHPVLRIYLWQWCKDNILSEDFLILYVLIIPCVIVLICILIEVARTKIMNLFISMKVNKDE